MCHTYVTRFTALSHCTITHSHVYMYTEYRHPRDALVSTNTRPNKPTGIIILGRDKSEAICKYVCRCKNNSRDSQTITLTGNENSSFVDVFFLINVISENHDELPSETACARKHKLLIIIENYLDHYLTSRVAYFFRAFVVTSLLLRSFNYISRLSRDIV